MNTQEQDIKNLMEMPQAQHHNYISSRYLGPANRFRRQELMKAITGLSIPLVQCGVSHIAEAIRKSQNELALAEEKALDESKEKLVVGVSASKKTETIEPQNLEVGTPVIRKKCKRKGVIKANVNGILEIELEDGAIRKPAARRFKSLYNFAIS